MVRNLWKVKSIPSPLRQLKLWNIDQLLIILFKDSPPRFIFLNMIERKEPKNLSILNIPLLTSELRSWWSSVIEDQCVPLRSPIGFSFLLFLPYLPTSHTSTIPSGELSWEREGKQEGDEEHLNGGRPLQLWQIRSFNRQFSLLRKCGAKESRFGGQLEALSGFTHSSVTCGGRFKPFQWPRETYVYEPCNIGRSTGWSMLPANNDISLH